MSKRKTRKETKARKRGKKAYETGAKLEKRVANWLKRQFGYECKKRDLARGKNLQETL